MLAVLTLPPLVGPGISPDDLESEFVNCVEIIR